MYNFLNLDAAPGVLSILCITYALSLSTSPIFEAAALKRAFGSWFSAMEAASYCWDRSPLSKNGRGTGPFFLGEGPTFGVFGSFFRPSAPTLTT